MKLISLKSINKTYKNIKIIEKFKIWIKQPMTVFICKKPQNNFKKKNKIKKINLL